MNTLALMLLATPFLFQSEPHRFGVLVEPPKDHHFNLNAPMSATVTPKSSGKEIEFVLQKKSDKELLFSVTDAAVQEGDQATVEAFICDNAKKYCVKKRVSAILTAHVDPKLEARFKKLKKVSTAPSKSSTKTEKSNAFKDEHGFWNNSPDLAIAEAEKTGKQLLIDFYGIWCPPCNLFNEVVFPKTEFKKAAKDFVLLKMDADQELSWELKSKFKVGGYPTLIFATSKLAETGRVVGFLNLKDLTAKMKEIRDQKGQSSEERVAQLKGKPGHAAALKELIEVYLEQKDYEKADQAIEQGSKLYPEDLEFKILVARNLLNLKHEKWTKDKKALAALVQSDEVTSVFALTEANIKKLSNAALVQTASFGSMIVSELEDADPALQKMIKAKTSKLIQELNTRAHPKTLQLDGVEASVADLDSLRMDMAEATGDEAELKAAREEGVAHYRQIIRQLDQRDSRGLNLELAYLLRKTGKVKEAEEIYLKFIKKYPTEFTYYFSAARHYQELKEYSKARAMADQAVKYAYGDNKIRSVELQAKIMEQQGQKQEALKTIDAFLASFEGPSDDLKVRTKRHLDSLKDLKQKLETSKN